MFCNLSFKPCPGTLTQKTPEYERRRNANIIRNNEKLRSLGLYTSPVAAPPFKRAPARKRVRQPKQPTRTVLPRTCISKHTVLSESALAPVFLSDREPEQLLASRFKLSMGKRKSLAPVHWGEEYAPTEEGEADATELYYAFLPEVKKAVTAQQAACWLAANDLAREDIINATEEESAARLAELLQYMEPITSGMNMRLTRAWKAIRSRISSGTFEIRTHADGCYQHLAVAGCH